MILGRVVVRDDLRVAPWRLYFLKPTLAELGFDAVLERGQPPSIMGGCVD